MCEATRSSVQVANSKSAPSVQLASLEPGAWSLESPTERRRLNKLLLLVLRLFGSYPWARQCTNANSACPPVALSLWLLSILHCCSSQTHKNGPQIGSHTLESLISLIKLVVVVAGAALAGARIDPSIRTLCRAPLQQLAYLSAVRAQKKPKVQESARLGNGIVRRRAPIGFISNQRVLNSNGHARGPKWAACCWLLVANVCKCVQMCANVRKFETIHCQ